MKSRSEVMRTRGQAKSEPKPSAEARTEPLPAIVPSGWARCDACGATAEASMCAVRNDGFAECPDCGAPMTLDASAAPPATKPEAFAPKHPERKWCGECATEVSFTPKGMFFPCGHDKAERVDDPRKAKKVKPAAGHQTRTEHEIERRRAAGVVVDAKGDTAVIAHGAAPSTPASVAVQGNRLSVQWGESRMPIDQFNSFKCGGFIATVDLPEGADRVAEAEKILRDLEQIADKTFQRQREWYAKKLGLLEPK